MAEAKKIRSTQKTQSPSGSLRFSYHFETEIWYDDDGGECIDRGCLTLRESCAFRIHK